MSEKTNAKPKGRVRIVIHAGDRPEDQISWADWVEIAIDATRHDEDVRAFAARFAADALADHAAGCREKRLEREAEERAEARAAEERAEARAAEERAILERMGDGTILAVVSNPDILEARLRELAPERLA